MSGDARSKEQNLFASSLEWRKECEMRAHKIVESLIEPGITETQLIDSATALDPDHYERVSEERYLDHLCGYPLCDNHVDKVDRPYHISVKTKKVYELTERKQFCSGWCYKASKYFSAQLDPTPLWARGNDKSRPVELLQLVDTEKKDGGSAKSKVQVVEGDQSVDSTITSLEQTHLSDTASSNGSDTRNGDTQDQPTASVEKSDTTSDVVNSKPELTLSHERKTEIIKQDTPKPTVGPKHYGAPSQKLSPRERVMAALLEWKTPKTVKFLKGTEPDLNQLDEPVDNGNKYLPNIDSHNQISMRRKIATQQLMKGVTPIVHQVGLSVQQVSDDIVAIMTTFNLQASNVNVTIQPSLRTAVAAIILLLIRSVNKDVGSTINISNTMPFINKAELSEDDIKNCLSAFES
ncbi:putative RNA polymerase II subunit B1 CTD phosphatase rpap2 isoform X1 [Dysidea avara]|uniref:putative RNA polymerase II subunit B1 CTD phosphatase rpap2 isoform X1 n=1 Tax=Dysidea avara TaxID=196820 RepID=UPI00332D1F40